jgi:hypothetical protein
VKELYFIAYFYRHLRDRYSEGNGFGISDNDDDNGDSGSVHDKFFQALDSQLIRLFNLLVNDSL